MGKKFKKNLDFYKWSFHFIGNTIRGASRFPTLRTKYNFSFEGSNAGPVFSRTHIVRQFVIMDLVNLLNPLQLFADLFTLVFNVSNVKDPQTLPRNSSPKRDSFSAPWDNYTDTKTFKRL